MRSSTPKVRARQLAFSPPASLSLFTKDTLCATTTTTTTTGSFYRVLLMAKETHRSDNGIALLAFRRRTEARGEGLEEEGGEGRGCRGERGGSEEGSDGVHKAGREE